MNNHSTNLQHSQTQFDHKTLKLIAIQKAKDLKIDPLSMGFSTFDELSLSISQRRKMIQARGMSHLVIQCPIHGLTFTRKTTNGCIECTRYRERQNQFATGKEREEWDGTRIRFYMYTDSHQRILYVGQTSKKLCKRHSNHAHDAWVRRLNTKWCRYLRDTYKSPNDFKSNCKPQLIQEELIENRTPRPESRAIGDWLEAVLIENYQPLYNSIRPSALKKYKKLPECYKEQFTQPTKSQSELIATESELKRLPPNLEP